MKRLISVVVPTEIYEQVAAESGRRYCSKADVVREALLTRYEASKVIEGESGAVVHQERNRIDECATATS